MLAESGDTAAADWGLLGAYWGSAGNPGGDLDLAASKALTASERRRSVGDSTGGDLAPSANFCSSILMGVEQSEGILAGEEDAELLGVLGVLPGGGDKAPE